eukprot:Rmarinus@m.5016
MQELTDKEKKRFLECMDDKEFRDLFMDYARDLQDPKTREEYEAYFRQLEEEEKQGGAAGASPQVPKNVFVPKPGFCIRTYSEKHKKKTFVNLCYHDKVDEGVPTKQDGGSSWDLPYILSNARPDHDKNGVECLVYDITFNTKTYNTMRQNSHYENFLIQTALDSIDENRGDCLRREWKVLSKAVHGQTQVVSASPAPGGKYPFGPYENPPPRQQPPAKNKPKTPSTPSPELKQSAKPSEAKTNDSGLETPEFDIIHRGELDYQDFLEGSCRDAKEAKRPKELVIRINLPQMASAANMDLDIEDKLVILEAKPHYYLKAPLPYEVDSDRGSAKFDKSQRRLTVTLPVLPKKRTPA